MNIVKRIPFRIFLLVLLAGIMGLIGIFIMRHNIVKISENYERLMEENLRDRFDMSELSNLMYSHQALISRHVLMASAEEMEGLEKEAEELYNLIMGKLTEMGVHIAENKKEQYYHKVYSDIVNYFKNVDIVFQMSKAGNTATANYYISSVMTDYINNINKNIDNMDGFISEEMQEAKRRMSQSLEIARTSEIVCVACVVVVMIVCMILCTNMTSRLENYKNQLEIEVERKQRQLIKHNRKMLAMQDNIIIGMANLIESRDGDTGGHIKRTSKYVELLARKVQSEGYFADIVTDDYIELLTKAAPMHDIGKISVPDNILRKPGKLTDEEFDCMKQHTSKGKEIIYNILGNIEEQEYIEIAAQIVSGHHEKWDGSGYPEGLKGEQIPLCARIMAVADVFDALISKRCYKEPFAADKAFEIIEASGGSHFDPQLAKFFIDMRADIESVIRE